MQITLIFPPNTYQTKQGIAPLGIAWLVAVLRESGFNDVFLLDSIGNRYSNSEIIDLLKQKDPDFIRISFNTLIRSSAFELAKLIKQNCQKIFPGPNLILEIGHIRLLTLLLRCRFSNSRILPMNRLTGM